MSSDEGSLDMRGVPDGTHAVLVGAKRHVTETREVVIADGEHVQLEVVLRPAP